MRSVDKPIESSAPAWLEVSLVVDGELAEAVAEVLGRYAPNGVAIQATDIKQDVGGEGIGVGPLRVCAYLAADARLEETRQKLEQALWFLGRIRPMPEPQFKSIQDADWSEAWKAHYQPILVGDRLVIQPAWLENPAPERLAVLMEPGMAFGTGTHPTTQLCLQTLEARLEPGQNVIDVGCGSGILSIAAARLGAGKVVGVDIDREAIPIARENARLNDLAQRVDFHLGSVDELLRGEFGLTRAPVVLANILATVIVRLLKVDLAELVEQGGILVLSGILESQLSGQDGHLALLPILKQHGLRVIETRQIDDWVALVVAA
jgi:ribosomal protein L11 methyltransferase